MHIIFGWLMEAPKLISKLLVKQITYAHKHNLRTNEKYIN